MKKVKQTKENKKKEKMMFHIGCVFATRRKMKRQKCKITLTHYLRDSSKCVLQKNGENNKDRQNVLS